MKTYTLYLFTGFQLVIELTVIGKLTSDLPSFLLLAIAVVVYLQEEEYNHT
jgi:hypothetical protein